ncbi:MAG: alkaline phosphatase family protein, partial [Chloroflexota bacterium]
PRRGGIEGEVAPDPLPQPFYRPPPDAALRLFAVAALTLLLLVGCAASGSPPPTPRPASPETEVSLAVTPPGTVPHVSHVFVIVMENHEYGEIVGSSEAPYFNQLANTYGLANRYYAIRHPSLPNYLALMSGSTQGMTDDCGTCSVDAPNLVDQLEAHGKTWGAYLEDLPAPCFNGASAGGPLALVGRGTYVRRHNPFMYFANIRDNPARCDRVVPLDRFSEDLSHDRLPDFVWITPNLRHDMHSASIRAGDDWLASFVPKILDSSAWRNGGVLFITWDEGTTDAGCCGNAAGGRVATLVIAPNSKPGYRSETPYTHYSLLRTVEDAWQLGHLGHAGDPTTNPMADFFR